MCGTFWFLSTATKVGKTRHFIYVQVLSYQLQEVLPGIPNTGTNTNAPFSLIVVTIEDHSFLSPKELIFE
jgi:hypothetical protein